MITEPNRKDTHQAVEFRYPTKTDYRVAWQAAFSQDPPIPLNVDIELASLCNLACSMCYWGEGDGFAESMNAKEWDGGKKKRFMPTEMAYNLIDECARIGVPAIKMNFRGESTLHPEYAEIMLYASLQTAYRVQSEDGGYDVPAFHEILVNTNANCSDRAVEGLMSATKCMVSLDSCDPAIYPKIRVNGKMERAFEVIRELKRWNHPNLWVRRVITQINKDEPFVEKVKELFGDDTQVSEHFAWDRNRQLVASVHGENADQWERTYCGYPSQRLVVTASGMVLPCCIDWSQTLPVGEWPRESLLDIWHGAPMRRLRDDLRANRLETAPEICRKCTSYMAYKRPERNFVQDVEGKAVL